MNGTEVCAVYVQAKTKTDEADNQTRCLLGITNCFLSAYFLNQLAKQNQTLTAV